MGGFLYLSVFVSVKLVYYYESLWAFIVIDGHTAASCQGSRMMSVYYLGGVLWQST